MEWESENSASQLKAIIFDFNGVICNDEAIHKEVFQRVLGEEGVQISDSDYSSTFLGRDDRECFRIALNIESSSEDKQRISSLTQKKTAYYLKRISKDPPIFPGVVSLILQASGNLSLAIASGALRSEIEFVLDRVGILDRFQAIVSSHDIPYGKPAPDIFLKALEEINRLQNHQPPISPEACLVIEDSVLGVRAALAAGMKCLAVTNSYSDSELGDALHRITDLNIDLHTLIQLFMN